MERFKKVNEHFILIITTKEAAKLGASERSVFLAPSETKNEQIYIYNQRSVQCKYIADVPQSMIESNSAWQNVHRAHKVF